MIRSIFSSIKGYLLGSILITYALRKLMLKIDIGYYESKNPSEMNTLKVLDPTYEVIKVLFDMLKSLLAIFIAYLLKVLTFIYS